MNSPWEPFPYYLAQAQAGYIAAPSMLNNADGTTHPVGTGPFIFKEWIPNSHFTATANPRYWRKGLPYLSSITFKPIIDPSSRVAALEVGHHRHHAHEHAARTSKRSGATRSGPTSTTAGPFWASPM